MKKTRCLLIAIVLIGFISCTDNSTNSDNSGPEEGQGTMNVTGEIEAEHKGTSWFIGLRSEGANSYINLTFNISDVGFASEEENTYGFTIRMVGDEGPFELSTGEYEIGESGGMVTIANYTNKEGPAIARYGTSPDASGTVTIQSISDTSIEASFDVTLEAGQNTELSGFANVTGNLTANCVESPATTAGCPN